MAAVAMPTGAATSAAAALAARLAATPSHYAHMAFPLPDKRYVGMLHCQRDPLAATLVTRVVRCDKVDKSSNSTSGASKAKAKAKKGSTAPPNEQDVVDDEWQVELADTVLFPEGGGQPSDTGRIVPLLPDGQEDSSAPAAAVVRQVIRRNLDAVHFVSKPFEVGAQVRLEVDMDRRRDLMDQHTGQHLLSAVLEHEYQADTLSWSLQKYPELNYVELPRNLTPEEIAAVQRRCNDLIDEARPIRVKFELATEETGVQLGEHVPSDYKAGEHGDERPPVQRTVIIDQLDENPCCGTHYPSLSYLRTLYISPNTTSIRGTNTRLYFAVGSSRVLAYLASVQSPARQAALHAGCAIADLPNKVEGLVSAGTDLKRREKRLQAELAQWVAKDLWERAASQALSSCSSCAPASASEDASGGAAVSGTITGSLLREEDATNSLEFLSTVALELKQRAESQQQQQQQQQQQSQEKEKYVFLLASGATSGSPGAAAAGGAVLIFGTDESAVAAAGKGVVEQFGKERIKGGGKGRWQGKVTGRWEKGDELLLEEIVIAAAAAAAAGGK